MLSCNTEQGIRKTGRWLFKPSPCFDIRPGYTGGHMFGLAAAADADSAQHCGGHSTENGDDSQNERRHGQTAAGPAIFSHNDDSFF